MNKILFLCLFFVSIFSAESLVQKFTKAMSGQDLSEKRAAISSISAHNDKSKVYTLLISAANDRQAKTFALKKLRSVSGLSPASKKGGNKGFPGFPTKDTASGWSSWNSARLADIARKEKEQELENKVKEANEKAEKAMVKASEDGDETPVAETEVEVKVEEGSSRNSNVPPPSTENLGNIDRIIFKNGGILLGYITVKRYDLDKNLTSIHVIHPDNAGEEDIEASTLSSVEEDFLVEQK